MCQTATISVSQPFYVVNVDIKETGTNACLLETVTFTLQNTCGGVTWEVWPDGPGAPQVSGGTVTAGTNTDTYTIIARSTINTNCYDSAQLEVLSGVKRTTMVGYGTQAVTPKWTYLLDLIPQNPGFSIPAPASIEGTLLNLDMDICCPLPEGGCGTFHLTKLSAAGSASVTLSPNALNLNLLSTFPSYASGILTVLNNEGFSTDTINEVINNLPGINGSYSVSGAMDTRLRTVKDTCAGCDSMLETGSASASASGSASIDLRPTFNIYVSTSASASATYNSWLEWFGPNVPTVDHKTRVTWSYYYYSIYQIGTWGDEFGPLTGSSPLHTSTESVCIGPYFQ